MTKLELLRKRLAQGDYGVHRVLAKWFGHNDKLSCYFSFVEEGRQVRRSNLVFKRLRKVPRGC